MVKLPPPPVYKLEPTASLDLQFDLLTGGFIGPAFPTNSEKGLIGSVECVIEELDLDDTNAAEDPLINLADLVPPPPELR